MSLPVSLSVMHRDIVINCLLSKLSRRRFYTRRSATKISCYCLYFFTSRSFRAGITRDLRRSRVTPEIVKRRVFVTFNQALSKLSVNQLYTRRIATRRISLYSVYFLICFSFFSPCILFSFERRDVDHVNVIDSGYRIKNTRSNWRSPNCLLQ